MNCYLTAAFICAVNLTLFSSPAHTSLPERYSKWLNQDVTYIITDQERKAFLALTADESRNKFIDDFWEIRNPGSPIGSNIYKEEHYRRIDYANSHFGKESNTPGWMTDMGRTWILFGKPTSRHPFVGYSQIYPMELWFYDNPTHSPSLPSFFYVLFYMPGDIGAYRFYRPYLDGPMQLVRGSQFHTNADVYRFLQPMGSDIAHASLSLIAGDPVDMQNYRPDMSSDMLVSKIQNFANDRFNQEQLRSKRALRGLVTSRLLTAGKALSLSTLVLTDPLQQKWVDYSIPIDDEKMGTRTADGQFAMNFRYSLRTDTGTLILEDETERKYPAYKASTFLPLEIAGRIPVVAGKYRLETEVINHKTGQAYRDQTVLTVPANGKDAWLSGPLLADSVSSVAQPNAAVPYQYFGVQFRPLFRLEAANNKKLRVLFQLYEPQPEAGEVEYALANVAVREARLVATEPVAATEFQGSLLMKSKTFDVSTLPPGEYVLAVSLKSDQGHVTASLNQRLHMVNSSVDALLYFVSDPLTLSRPGLVDYMRGLSAMEQGENAEAQQYLEHSLKVNPSNKFAKQFLAQAYYRQHNFKAVSDLFGRSSLGDFNDSPEAMAEIAVSLWDSGDASKARAVMKSARDLFPQDSLLALADKLVSANKN